MDTPHPLIKRSEPQQKVNGAREYSPQSIENQAAALFYKPTEQIQPRDVLALQQSAGNAAVNRWLSQTQAGEIPHKITDQIEAARGAGMPLPPEVKEMAERRLGQPLGDVRVHQDEAADRLSGQLNARAFTTGKDVFFRRGVYNPASPEGRKTILHELTHVAQQSRVGLQGRATQLGPAQDAFEKQADDFSNPQTAVPGMIAPAAAVVQRTFAGTFRNWLMQKARALGSRFRGRPTPPSTAALAGALTPGIAPAGAHPHTWKPAHTPTGGRLPAVTPPTTGTAATPAPSQAPSSNPVTPYSAYTSTESSPTHESTPGLGTAPASGGTPPQNFTYTSPAEDPATTPAPTTGGTPPQNFTYTSSENSGPTSQTPIHQGSSYGTYQGSGPTSQTPMPQSASHGTSPSPEPPSAGASAPDPMSSSYSSMEAGGPAEAQPSASVSPVPEQTQPPAPPPPPASYLTMPKHRGYEGENTTGHLFPVPGGPATNLRMDRTYYHPAGTPNPYEVSVNQGRLSHGGQAMDTTSAVKKYDKDKSGRYMFTMGQGGQFHAADVSREWTVHGRVHHTTMTAGAETAASGEMQVRQGRLEALADTSGHYKPAAAQTYQALRSLQSQGVDTGRATVELSGKNEGERRLQMSADEMMAYQPEMETALKEAQAYRDAFPLDPSKEKKWQTNYGVMKTILGRPETKIRAAHAKKDAALGQIRELGERHPDGIRPSQMGPHGPVPAMQNRLKTLAARRGMQQMVRQQGAAHPGGILPSHFRPEGAPPPSARLDPQTLPAQPVEPVEMNSPSPSPALQTISGQQSTSYTSSLTEEPPAPPQGAMGLPVLDQSAPPQPTAQSYTTRIDEDEQH